MKLLDYIRVPFLIFLGTLFTLNAKAQAQTAWPSLEQMVQDGTLVLISDYDRTLTGPAWDSMWVLERVPSVKLEWQLKTRTPHGDIEFDQLPLEVHVTENEFIEQFQDKIAVQESHGFNIRTRQIFELPALNLPGRKKPITFLPGFYTVTSRSFQFFRSNSEHNYLLADNKTAQSKEQRTGLSRFGLSFYLMQMLASTKEGIRNIHVVTARGQSQSEFYDLFRSWMKEGWLDNIYGPSRRTSRGRVADQIEIHAMGRGESILYGTHLTEKKVRVLDEKILTQYRLQATQEGRKYYFVIPEDNPVTIEYYHQLLSRLSSISNYKDYMEFMVVHTGSETEVRESSLPSRYTIYENGFPVSAPDKLVKSLFPKGPVEKMEVIRARTSERNIASNKCIQLFTGGL